MAREREGDGSAPPFSYLKTGVRADSVRMAQRLCGVGSMIVQFGSTNDIGGEVVQAAAYTGWGVTGAISDAEKGTFKAAYSALPGIPPTSPPISTNVRSYSRLPSPTMAYLFIGIPLMARRSDQNSADTPPRTQRFVPLVHVGLSSLAMRINCQDTSVPVVCHATSVAGCRPNANSSTPTCTSLTPRPSAGRDRAAGAATATHARRA